MPSTIKGYRAAIASVLKSGGSQAAASFDLSSLIRSLDLARPAERRFLPQWDLGVVLNYIKGAPFEPLGQATLEKLTLKTVFLLLLAMGRRRSQIAALAIDNKHIVFTANYGSVKLLSEPGFLAKTQVPSWKPDPIVIPALPTDRDISRELCPVRSLKVYLAKTQDPSLRKGRLRLFLPYKLDALGEVSSRHISAWICKLVKEAYSNTTGLDAPSARAHELRALSTSWALFNQATFSDVMSAGFWKSGNTFVSFYLRSMALHADSLYSAGPVVAASTVISPP